MNNMVSITQNKMMDEYKENNIHKPEYLKAINFLNDFDIILRKYLNNEFMNKKIDFPSLAYYSPEENECDITWNFDHVRIGFSFDNNYELNNNDCFYVVTDGTIDATNAWGYFRDYISYNSVIDFVISYCLKLCDKGLISPSKIQYLLNRNV